MKNICLNILFPPLQIGFYLFHESMLESVIYARDHFLSKTNDPETIQIFPSHAYLVSSFICFEF